jgi:hypothetical protein
MDSLYVFGRQGRSVRRYGWVRTDFAKAIQAAGLAGTRFHDLRHTAATQLRRLGRDLQVVQQLLGHKTIRTTMRYSHVHPTELREAVNRLGEKIMPKDPAHFTITSQSPVSDHGSDGAPSKNEAILQSETISRDFGMGGMPKTVKQVPPPSRSRKATTFRRSQDSMSKQD